MMPRIFSCEEVTPLEDPSQAKEPLSMITVPDARPAIDWSDQRFDNQGSRDVIRQGRRPQGPVPHLANLIKSPRINRISNHRIQLQQPMEISRLCEKIVTPEQLTLMVRAQTQRPAERKSGQSQILRPEARSTRPGAKDNSPTPNRNKVRHRRIPLRKTHRAIGPLCQVVVLRSKLRTSGRQLRVVLPQILKPHTAHEWRYMKCLLNRCPDPQRLPIPLVVFPYAQLGLCVEAVA